MNIWTKELFADVAVTVLGQIMRCQREDPEATFNANVQKSSFAELVIYTLIRNAAEKGVDFLSTANSSFEVHIIGRFEEVYPVLAQYELLGIDCLDRTDRRWESPEAAETLDLFKENLKFTRTFLATIAPTETHD